MKRFAGLKPSSPAKQVQYTGLVKRVRALSLPRQWEGQSAREERPHTGQEEVGFYCWGTFPLSLIYCRDVKELHPAGH